MEVRKRLFFTVVVMAAFGLAGAFFNEHIIKFFVGFLQLQGVNIVFTSPFQFINLALGTGFVVGLTCAFPLLLVQVLTFLKPALKPKEYQMVKLMLPFSILLFIFGFLFGALMMRWQMAIFLAKSVSLGIGNVLDISSLLSVVLLTSALMGIAFQTPIILLVLMKIGAVKRTWLAKKRLWVYIGSFLFATALPPDSLIADVLLSLPLVILFEVTLLLGRVMKTNNNSK